MVGHWRPIRPSKATHALNSEAKCLAVQDSKFLRRETRQTLDCQADFSLCRITK